MSEISNAIRQLCEDKGLSYDVVLTSLETALGAAYRKDFGSRNQNIKVNYNPETGTSVVFDVKTVVEDMPPEDVENLEVEDKNSKLKTQNSKGKKSKNTKKDDKKADAKEEKTEPTFAKATAGEEEERKFNPKTEIQLTDAKLIKADAELGDEIKIELEPPSNYGRMAAQTAKQVIIQKIREAERNMIIEEFKDKEGEVLSGLIQRQEGRVVLIDLGKAVGVLLRDEQIYNENYKPGGRIKVYVKEVREGAKGPEVILSRISEEILKKVFFTEIPEITNGLIELKNVAREAGSRSKVSVASTAENIDPIGSCVGQRGARIQTIISELGGEKVDIIEYDEDPVKFITNALSPAKIISVDLKEDDKKAVITVADDQQSLAIGKGGQNVRLAARLTGWSIDVVGAGSDEEKSDDADVEKNEEEDSESKDNGEKPSSAKATAGKEDESTETEVVADEDTKEDDTNKEDKKEDESASDKATADEEKEDKKPVKKKAKATKEKKSASAKAAADKEEELEEPASAKLQRGKEEDESDADKNAEEKKEEKDESEKEDK